MKKLLLSISLLAASHGLCLAQVPSSPPAAGICSNGTLSVSTSSANSVLPSVVTLTGVIASVPPQLTSSSVTGTLANGQVVSGTGVPPLVKITNQVSGTTGGAGVYGLQVIGTLSVSSESMTAAPTTCNLVQLLNDGANEVFVAFGGSSVAATTSSVPIPPGNTLLTTFSVTSPYVAAITASGSSTLRILQLN